MSFDPSQTVARDGVCWVKGDRKEEGRVKEAFEDLGDANPGCGEGWMGQQEQRGQECRDIFVWQNRLSLDIAFPGRSPRQEAAQL